VAQTRTTAATIRDLLQGLGEFGNNDGVINNVIFLSVDDEAGTADSLMMSDVVINRR
jgi:hypothetical protein